MKDIFELFGKAFYKTAKVETAVNGFKHTGVYPYDDTVFDERLLKNNDTTFLAPQTPEVQNYIKTVSYTHLTLPTIYSV